VPGQQTERFPGEAERCVSGDSWFHKVPGLSAAAYTAGWDSRKA
jgi:hypothetical protein